MLLRFCGHLVFGVVFFSKCYCDVPVATIADNRKPVWNIAHMVNDHYQIDYYLNQGANSIEFDIVFDLEGLASYTFHDMPCDCFRRCMRYDNFITYLDYLRQLTTPDDIHFRKELVLLFMDLKVQGLSLSAQISAGKDITLKLLDYYWQRGYSDPQAYILISLPSINNIGVIKAVENTLRFENSTEYYSNKIGFDFSGNEDLDTIQYGLESAGIQTPIWQGDGITNCFPRGTSRLLKALDRRDQMNGTYINKIYWWTVDKMSTMRRILSLGVDGLITNDPLNLVKVLNEKDFSRQLRLATIEDNPWKKQPPRKYSIIDNILQAGNVIDMLDPDEILYNN